MKARRRERREHETETDSEGTWAISYGDMITLLLTFFILFFNINKDKEKAVAKAIQESLIAKLSEQAVRAPAQATTRPDLANVNVATAEGQGIEPEVVAKLGARIHKLGPRLLVEFPNISFYDFRAVDVSHSGLAALRKFTQSYLPYAGTNQLTIRAYTDDRPVIAGVKGRAYRDNLELSLLRSLSAVRVMQKAGLPLNRMRPSAFGELHLPASVQNEMLKEYPGAKGNPWARKVVMIIEPEAKEDL